jgi:dTDP-4-amino-4,6-dideoxygalactose transaminase
MAEDDRRQNTAIAAWPVYEQDEIAAVQKVLQSGKVNYWTGDECTSFEKEFAGECDTQYAVALANGTVALELALEAAGIGPGDEVIVTPRSFIASASCAARVRAIPVFADVSLGSQNLTPESVRASLTPRTRAIIAVHHAGWPCDMDELMAIATEHDLLLIEDCAQAHGAKYKSRPVGSLGHIAAFSFCQDKIITTGGEGGMLVTNDEDLWRRSWEIKDHGRSYDATFNREHEIGFRWLNESFGTNFRMTEMQAAIGRLQLRKLRTWNERRTANAHRIIESLQKHRVVRVPLPSSVIRHAFYRLFAFVEQEELGADWSRDRIIRELNDVGIPCFSGTCPELYREKAFAQYDSQPNTHSENARTLGRDSLAFLVHPTLSASDLDRVCCEIDRVLGSAAKSD